MRSIALMCSAVCAAVPLTSVAAPDVLEEVVVTATLRETALIDVPLSVTVLNERSLQEAGRQHFEDVLIQVPNLHWAGGTSRPRYFQLRGIGEREQWEGAPNPSVGFLIDDIDFSGVGMPATLFDLDQIEVLRGPQGMRYGANALAGLIVLRSRQPEQEFGFSTEASFGDYGSRSLGAAMTGPIEALDSSWRLAVHRHWSDGFRDATYLGRDDTNDRDELTVRGKWRWQWRDDTTVDFTWMHADIDNGYDAWSIDNTRCSLADRPGKDAQQADAGAIRIESQALPAATLTLIGTYAHIDGEYSYDEDWGNPESWAPYTYDYFYSALSERRSRSLELRLASNAVAAPGSLSWIAGAYLLDVDHDIDERRDGVFIDPDFPEFSGASTDVLASRYAARNVALFAQVESRFSERWGWSAGIRGEEREADYRDDGDRSGTPRITRASERNRMWGGQASLFFDARPNVRLFTSLSRGYKAGGFNLGRAAEISPHFAPEYVWSLDVGAKGEWFDRRLYADVTLFHMKRDDMQVSTGVQEDGAAASYIFITDNAAGGRNSGIETSVRWRALDQLELGGSLGLLRTRYSGYRPTGEDVSDRDQAHSPEYQVSLNATWRHTTGWMARVDFAAIDNFYFDVPPADQRAAAYSLTHVKAGFETDRWSIHAFVRNVFDEEYVVRGFYFANEPPNWEDKRYVQLGEPRQVGVVMRYQW